MAELFIELSKDPILIDKSVYEEAVEEGIKRGYSDADQVAAILQKYNIPIIPIDIRGDLDKFRDPGETSCFLLARQDGVCVTSDQRATKKMAIHGVLGIQLDNFFYQHYLNEKLPRNKLLDVLDKLENVNATTPDRKLVFLKSIFMHQEEKKNE